MRRYVSNSYDLRVRRNLYVAAVFYLSLHTRNGRICRLWASRFVLQGADSRRKLQPLYQALIARMPLLELCNPDTSSIKYRVL